MEPESLDSSLYKVNFSWMVLVLWVTDMNWWLSSSLSWFFPLSSWYSTAFFPCLGRSCQASRAFVLFTLFIYPRAPILTRLEHQLQLQQLQSVTTLLLLHPLQISLEGRGCAVSWVRFGCLSDWCTFQKLRVFCFPSSVVCWSQCVSTFSVWNQEL